MNTHTIQCHDKIRKFPYTFVFLSYWKNCVGFQKRVRIVQSKRATGARVIEVLLYVVRKWFVRADSSYV